MIFELYNFINILYWKLNGYKEVYCYFLVFYFFEDWIVEDLDEFEVLWTGFLKFVILFFLVVNSYIFKLFEDFLKLKVLLLFRFFFF